MEDQLLEALKKSLDERRTVKVELENRGVYSDGMGGYWLRSKLTIMVDNQEVFEKTEIVDNRSPGWYSNFTGAKVEEIYFHLVDNLTEYIGEVLVEELVKAGVDERDIYRSGDAVYYFKGKEEHELLFKKSRKLHNVGNHIFTTILWKPAIKVA